jgi:uncharacterized protein
MRISGITYTSRRTGKLKKFILVALSLIFVSAVVLALYSARVGWSLTHPDRKEVSAFTSNTIPEYTNISFSDINKSLTLYGWYFRSVVNSSQSDKTVILAHGYGQNRLQFDVNKSINMVKSFIAHGYNVLMFDFRNSGASEGNLTSIGIYEKDDLLGAVKYAKSQNSKHIVLMGFSMGASTSILAAAASTDIDAVIADSPFSDLTEYLNRNLTQWSKLPAFPFNKAILFSAKLLTGLDPEKMSPIAVIGKIAPRPILLIHSKNDTKIPVSDSEELYRSILKVPGSKAALWETQDAGHAESYDKQPKEYMDRVFKFLDTYFPKKPM